jgi:saccharopine dehydrogenase-like NADP-dependent oxidoreductase
MKIVALGGCGEMGRHAVAAAAAFEFVDTLVIADRDAARAAAFAERCGAKVSAVAVDVADDTALHRTLRGADVVLNTVGPFYETAVPILRAAIDEGCHYLDINDDWEPTLAVLELDATARAAGLTAIVGMGASPGITNLLAVTAMRRLDRVDTLYTGWNLGTARAQQPAGETVRSRAPSAAVIHFLHQITGTIRIRRDGAFADAKPIEEVRIDCPGIVVGSGWSVGHPEALTLPLHRPEIRTSLNVMVAPRALIEALRGLARDIDAGTLGLDTAAALLNDTPPASSGESSDDASVPPLFAVVVGARNGQPAVAGAKVLALPAGGMGGATGIPLAIGLQLLAQGRIRHRGVCTPEAGTDVDAFFDALAPRCAPPVRSGADLVVVR